MKAIVCADLNNCIGKDNHLLVRISEDLQRFRRLTLNHHIIMGRKTFDSLPKPLDNRACHVLSRTPHESHVYDNGAHVFFYTSIEEMLEALGNTDDVFVAGGSQIYEQFLPQCDTVYMTRVLDKYEGDSYFPELSEDDWTCETSSVIMKENHTFRFELYTRR